jgi:hypothetical protein
MVTSYNFIRFIHLGLRRLICNFSETPTDVGSRHDMAIAWAYQYFLISFTKSRKLRLLIILF